MEAAVRHDQGHLAAAAINGDLEVELSRERNNAAAAATVIPVVEDQEQPEETTDGRRTRGLVRRLHPAAVARACWRWLKHPAHLALVAWALCVAVSGSMLGLLLLGGLHDAFPRRSVRNRWIEINNQVLNALFTLMSIYQHPALFHHAALLLRWRPGDAAELREAYCRKGARAGGERAHMSVVVALLHVACFAQYAMCGLYWGYSRKARPEAVETSLAVVGTVTPVIAGLYTYFSPLGRRRSPSVHQEPEPPEAAASSDNGRGIAGEAGRVEWAGGLLDVGEDPTAWWLSCLCTFCVFGWNMERLGLGNARVHTVMFALLCFAPLWVLNIAANNIRNEAVADAVGASGVVLCAFGLLYGGFWRARMRRRYGLPGGGACSLPWLMDYIRWLFCWSCALAQEVRTADRLLDVEAGSVDRGDSGGGRAGVDGIVLQPLPRENGVKSSRQGGYSQLEAHPVRHENYSPSRGDESPLLRQEQWSSTSFPGEMTAPVPLSMPEGERGRGQ